MSLISAHECVLWLSLEHVCICLWFYAMSVCACGCFFKEFPSCIACQHTATELVFCRNRLWEGEAGTVFNISFFWLTERLVVFYTLMSCQSANTFRPVFMGAVLHKTSFIAEKRKQFKGIPDVFSCNQCRGELSYWLSCNATFKHVPNLTE